MTEGVPDDNDKGPVPKPQPQTDFGGPPTPSEPPVGVLRKYFRRRDDQAKLENKANEALLDTRHRRFYRTAAIGVGITTVAIFVGLLAILVLSIREHVTDEVSPLAVGLCASLILSVTVMVLGFAKYAFAPLEEKTAAEALPVVPSVEGAKLAVDTVGKILTEAGKALSASK